MASGGITSGSSFYFYEIQMDKKFTFVLVKVHLFLFGGSHILSSEKSILKKHHEK
jgi:hypothetical protein